MKYRTKHFRDVHQFARLREYEAAKADNRNDGAPKMARPYEIIDWGDDFARRPERDNPKRDKARRDARKFRSITKRFVPTID